MKVITKMKKKRIDKFQMSDMGDISLVEGMEVVRANETGTISVSQ